MRFFPVLLLIIIQGLALGASVPETPLGIPLRLNDIYISGEKVEPIPRRDLSSSIVIRILDIKTADNGYRYDIEAYGLDPGTYALKDFLRRIKDQSPITTLDTQLKVTTELPLDTLPPPEDLTHTPPEKLGGYRALLITLGSLWIIGFLFILFYKKKKPAVQETVERELTLQERLAPLVTSAAKGKLTTGEQASLERLIMAHWKEKLPDLQIPELRKHPESSPLLLKLEHWLHSPSPETSQEEIATLLSPYSTD